LNSVQEIVIEAGTTLAYKVWQLKVDVNGVTEPVMTPKKNGGFSPRKSKANRRCSFETVHVDMSCA
jgi:hypothetical protein